MNYTKTQEKFISGGIEHLQNGEGLKTCCGYAGTGKTTCAIPIIKAQPDTLILCPTHVSRQIMLKKLYAAGIKEPRVMTITSFLKECVDTKINEAEDKLLYFTTLEDEKGVQAMKDKIEWLISSGRANDPVFENKDDVENPKSIWLEEAGMTQREDMNELLLRAQNVLAVGDGFQLPPVVVNGDEYYQDWFSRAKYSWALTEVHRNAGDVLNFATRIRMSPTKFNLYDGISRIKMKDVLLVKKSEKLFQKIAEENIIPLAFYNDEVDRLCHLVRNAIGLDHNFVEAGEPLYAANNMNGKLTINNKDEVYFKERFNLTNHGGFARIVKSSNGLSSEFKVNTARLNNNLSEIEKKRLLSDKGLVLRFDRARTIYGAQGNEWQKVLWGGTVPSSMNQNKHNRMLYTAVTRAQERFGLIV